MPRQPGPPAANSGGTGDVGTDRILEEATATGTRDPMHLASMFGLHPNTAQRYVDAVYGRHDLAPADRPG